MSKISPVTGAIESICSLFSTGLRFVYGDATCDRHTISIVLVSMPGNSHSLCRFTHSMPCPCRAHAVHLPCRAAKGLECVFPIWFTQFGRVWFTLATPCPYRAHAMLWPGRSSQGHGTARPSRNGLWTTCPRSASSGYHAEFHEDCYQKHINPPHNDPYLRL